MDGINFHSMVLLIQHTISFIGTLLIFFGVLVALSQYLYYLFKRELFSAHTKVNVIRLDLARTLLLGLEFIIAADLISTTTAPDYYSVGIVASIVLIRTVLSYSLNREMATLRTEQT